MSPRPLPRVRWLPRPGAEFCEYRLDVPVVRSDTSETAAAAVLGDVLLLDTERPDADRLQEWATDRVATAAVQSRPDRLAVMGCSTGQVLPELLEHAVRSVVAPAPPAAAVRAEAERIAVTSRMLRRHPAGRVRRADLTARWGDHPAAHETAHPDQLIAVGVEDVTGFARRGLRPEQAVLTICGDPADAPRGLDRLLPGPDAVTPLPDDTPAPTWGAGRHRVDTGPDPLTRLRWAWPALDRSHPDYPALHAFSLVLGGFFGSRLVQRLRERDGAVYGLDAGFETSRTSSTLTLTIDTPHAKAAGVLAAVAQELDDLLQHGPRAAELEAAVTYAVNSSTVALAAASAHAAAVAGLALAGLDPEWWVRYADAARELTPDEVHEVALATVGTTPGVHVHGGPHGEPTPPGLIPSTEGQVRSRD